MRNWHSLSWWAKNYENAESFSSDVVGSEIRVSVLDVMPNLRAANHDMGAEFDQCQKTAPSVTSGPIFVGRDKYSGVLVITDGHHRFNEAITRGERFVSVYVEEEICAWEVPFRRLSQDEIQNLKTEDKPFSSLDGGGMGQTIFDND